jgi:hypothetical protein
MKQKRHFFTPVKFLRIFNEISAAEPVERREKGDLGED